MDKRYKVLALAEKEPISPEDLWNQPLLISQQETEGGRTSQWMKRCLSELDIIMTYNLLFNASLLVEEGLGPLSSHSLTKAALPLEIWKKGSRGDSGFR